MRTRYVKGLLFWAHGQDQLKLETQLNAPPTPVAKPTRHQRRANQVFNQRMEERLKKDGTPATVKVLADGGVHITIKGERDGGQSSIEPSSTNETQSG